MPLSPSETLTLVGGGFLLGLSIAVPLGPINLEMIRRGVSRHPLAGLAVGLGATSLDTICILASGFGLGWLIENRGFAVVCYVVGALLLGWMAFGSVKEGIAKWREPVTSLAGQGGGERPERVELGRGFAYGLGVHAANPMTYVFWTTIPLTFFKGEVPSQAMVLTTTFSVLAGCMAWNLALFGIIAVARRFLTSRFLGGACVVGGVALAGFAVMFGWKALVALR